MPQIAGTNPWLSMWSRPKSTIRAIIHSDPAYGVIYLAAIYALQSLFFYANWWSLGQSVHFYTILLIGVITAPLVGLIWIYYLGWIFYGVGRLLKGQAPASHVRAALAWSLLPSSINLLMWVVLLLMAPMSVFIQDAELPSSIFINLIGIILGLWSAILLVQALCEVQQFSICRSIATLFISWFISSFFLFCLFFLIRYLIL